MIGWVVEATFMALKQDKFFSSKISQFYMREIGEKFLKTNNLDPMFSDLMLIQILVVL